MLRHERSAPIWLFSFVDLAFLLLIAFTQISPIDTPPVPGLAEIEIPQIESSGEPLTRIASATPWQLRIHSADPDSEAPFELISPQARERAGTLGTVRIDSEDLARALAALVAEATEKPVLTPHPDARAEDLLVAVGLLGDAWPRGRAVAVLPRPAVAAGPTFSSDSSSR